MLGLHKQDNTNGTCPADMKQIIIRLSNNAVNKITEIMLCSNSTANTLGSSKWNDNNGICWWCWADPYAVETCK